MYSSGITPVPIFDENYWVKSQFTDKEYQTSLSSCTCPDNKTGYVCKHILLLKGHLNDNNKKCLKCGSENVVKNGLKKGKYGVKQTYKCKSCNSKFVDNDISEYKANMKVIIKCMDLYFKGESYRSIVNTLKQFHNIKVNPDTIMKWVKKYTIVIDTYLSNFKPVVSDTWHTDEQFIKVKGNQKYIWNCMDNKTKFLLASNVTNQRSTKDALKLFKMAKSTAGKKAQTVITDGSFSYSKSVKKEFATYKNKKPHYRYVSLKQKNSNNNIIERYHGTHKDRTKSMRGMKSLKGVQTYNIGFKNYYNFVKSHMGLNGLTPAQASGLNVPANWENILKKYNLSEPSLQQKTKFPIPNAPWSDDDINILIELYNENDRNILKVKAMIRENSEISQQLFGRSKDAVLAKLNSLINEKSDSLPRGYEIDSRGVSSYPEKVERWFSEIYNYSLVHNEPRILDIFPVISYYYPYKHPVTEDSCYILLVPLMFRGYDLDKYKSFEQFIISRLFSKLIDRNSNELIPPDGILEMKKPKEFHFFPSISKGSSLVGLYVRKKFSLNENMDTFEFPEEIEFEDGKKKIFNYWIFHED